MEKMSLEEKTRNYLYIMLQDYLFPLFNILVTHDNIIEYCDTMKGFPNCEPQSPVDAAIDHDTIYLYLQYSKKHDVCYKARMLNFTTNAKSLIYFAKYLLKALLIYIKSSFNKNLFHAIMKQAVQDMVIYTLSGIMPNSNIWGEKNRTRYNICSGINEVLEKYKYWALRTYEGREVCLGVKFLPPKRVFNIANSIKSYIKQLDKNASALVGDGISSYWQIGETLTYQTITKNIHPPKSGYCSFAPYMYYPFATSCTDECFGFVLTANNEILAFKNQELLYCFTSNRWHRFDYNSFHCAVKNAINVNDNKIRKLYSVCLDVAFSRCGGGLIICDKENLDNILSKIVVDDIFTDFESEWRKVNGLVHAQLENRKDAKRIMLEKTINHNNFYDMNRQTIKELLSVDGATIITKKGEFVSAGAVLSDGKKTEKSQRKDGGARTQIMRNMSQYGLAIKISADGNFNVYDKHITIF